MNFLVVIPAYNEESIIESTLVKVDSFLRSNFQPEQYQVIVADNGSIDKTNDIVCKLSGQLLGITCLTVPQKGKGVAIKKAWEQNLDNFELLVFMDADLATDLEALPRLLEQAKNSDLVIGDRYHPDSYRQRSLKRSLFSRGYRALTKIILGRKINDYPCGFKAIKSETAKVLLPQVQNQTWFFDSELVFLADMAGYKIAQIPVRWIDRLERSQSKVNIFQVSKQYLKELIRLARGRG